MWTKKKFVNQKHISSYQNELQHLNEIFSPINASINTNKPYVDSNNQIKTTSTKIESNISNIPLFTRRKRYSNSNSNVFHKQKSQQIEEIITFEPEEINDKDTENISKESEQSFHNNINQEYINIDYEPNIIEEEEQNEILQQKIDQLLEFKEQKRKCLLNENEDKLYGGNTHPKDIIKDIYSIINHNSSQNISLNEEIDSDNEQMIKNWEDTQYKSGLNLHNLHKKYKEDTEDNIDDIFEGVYNKIKSKSIFVNYNDIINHINNDINKDKTTLRLVDERKEQYKTEIENLNKNEFQIKEKIENYIKQYTRIVKDLENMEWVKDAKKDKKNDDYVIESNIKIYHVNENKKVLPNQKDCLLKENDQTDILYISS